MFVLNILLLCLTIPYVLSKDLLHSQFPLYGLSEVAANDSLNVNISKCNVQIKSLYYALKKQETWALRMLDSSGSPANGFIWGNNYWLGIFSQCRWMSSKKPMLTFLSLNQSSLEFPPFEVDFYITLFKQNSNFQSISFVASENVIHLGLCLPSVCTTEDLAPLLTLWSKQRSLTVQRMYNFSMEFQKVRLLQSNFSWIYSPLTVILIIILATAILLTISGTIYDIYVWSPFRKKIAIESQCENNKPIEVIKIRNIEERSGLLIHDNNLNGSHELKIDNSQHKPIPVHIIKPRQYQKVKESTQSSFTKFILCFSAVSSTKKLFEASNKKDEQSVIHGLRFLGMLWLIWLYTIFFLKYYSDNKLLAQKISEGFSDRIISSSTFPVDTLFFTSGFMLAFKYYKNRRASVKNDHNFSIKKNVNEFSFLVFKKFIRVTPVYAVVLLIVIVCMKIMRQTSLFEIVEPADEICKKYWWRNIAYLNNLFSGNEMCMSWSWYLSTEMQFFLLGMFILILSTRFWKFTSFAVVTLIVLSSVITGYLSYEKTFVSLLQLRLPLLHVLHYSPWTRVSPYLIGMFTGYLVIRLKGVLTIKKTTLIAVWVMWFLCNLWVLFGQYSKNLSFVATALHTALSRTIWGFILLWIVVICCTRQAGAINSFLSYSRWIPLSKLSYSTYLLSPLVINLLILNREIAIHLDFFQMVVYFFGHLGITYMCAFFLYTVLEIPLATLGKKVIGKAQTQNQLNQHS